MKQVLIVFAILIVIASCGKKDKETVAVTSVTASSASYAISYPYNSCVIARNNVGVVVCGYTVDRAGYTNTINDWYLVQTRYNITYWFNVQNMRPCDAGFTCIVR